MTDAERAFADDAALRGGRIPTHWVEPELVEQQASSPGASGGPVSLDALMTQAHRSADTTWIVHAPAGIGKTTLLRVLEANLLNAQTPVIFLNAAMLRIRGITKDVEAVDLVRDSRPATFPEKLWKACVKRRDVVILLDGINEIRREFPAGPVWRLVGKLLGWNHGFTVIAASRDPDEDFGDMRLVRRLKIQDFTSAQTLEYLAANGLDANACVEWLDTIGLKGACSIPLLLRSVVMLLGPVMRADIRPASRAELLRAAALSNVERGRIPPEVTHEIESGAVIDAAWAACAARAHSAGSGKFTRGQALELLQACLPGIATGGVLDLFLELGPVDRAMDSSAWDPASFLLSHDRYTELGLALGWGPTVPPTITHDNQLFGGFIADWCALQRDPAETIRRIAPTLASGAHFDTLCDILLANAPLLNVTTRAELWGALGGGFTLPRLQRTRLADAVGSLPRPVVRDGLTAGLLRRLGVERPDIVGQVRDALLTGTLDGRRLQRIYRQAERRNSVALARRGLGEDLIGQSTQAERTDGGAAGIEGTATLLAGTDSPTGMESSIGDSDQVTGDEFAKPPPSTDDLIQMLFVDVKAMRVFAARHLCTRLEEPAVVNLGRKLSGLSEPQSGYLVGALGVIGSAAYIPSIVDLLESQSPTLRRKAVTALGLICGTTALGAIRGRVGDSDPGVRGAVATALGRCGEILDLRSLIALAEDPDRITKYSALGAICRYLNFRNPDEHRPLHSPAEVDEAVAFLETSPAATLGRVCMKLRTMVVPGRAELFQRWTEHTAPEVRGAALTALESIDEPLALHRARSMLEDGDDVNRAAAVTVIGRTGNQDDAARIRTFLHDSAANVRGGACQALARLGDVGEVITIATLMNDQDPIVRGSACTAVGVLGMVQGVPVLIQRLEDPVANVRGSAAKALGLLDATEALPQLFRALMDDEARVRGTTAVALGTLGDPLAVPPLVSLIKDPSADVRRGVVFALGQFGEASGMTAIVETADDPEPAVRWTVAKALGHIGDPSAIEVLVQLLQDNVSHVRGAAATALGHLGQSSAVEPIMEKAHDIDSVVRGSVATALGRIGNSVAMEVLMSLASDQIPAVRSAAISALGRGNFSTAIKTVEDALRDGAPEVRGAALRALARLEPGRDLTPHLTDPVASVRRATIGAIGEGSGAGVSALLQALHDEDAETRSVAVMALARRPSEVSIAGLVDALDDSSPEVGQAAAESLGHVVDEKELRIVTRALTSAHRSVRLAAAEILGTRGDRAADSALQQMLRHNDPRSRVAAAQALGQIGSSVSAPALIDALQDVDGYVRGTAAAALARVGIGSDAARAALLSRLADSNEAVVGLAARSLGVLGGDGVADRLKNCAMNAQNSMWTRTAAVQSAALLYRRPQPWMRELADEHRGASLTSGQARFRGAIIDAVTRGAWNDEVTAWTREIRLTDYDPVNQTAAATSLGNCGLLSPQLARDFLADAEPTPRGRPQSRGGGRRQRDSAATGAVLQAAIKSTAQDSIDRAAVAGIVSETLDQTNSAVLASSTLSALRWLEPHSAIAILQELRARLRPETQHRLEGILQRKEDETQHRVEEVRAYQQLVGEPHRFLNAFTSNQPVVGGGDPEAGCDLGVVTIIGEEARAVQEWLLRHADDARRPGPRDRFVYRAIVPAGNFSARVISTQALDQGQTSATNAFHYLVQNFQPRFMVLLGIAGGIHSDVSLGDVVIGTHVIDYGPAASTPGGVRHRGSAFRPPAHIVAALNDFFSTGGEPREIAAHRDSVALEKPLFTLQRGPIGTGPRVVKFKDAEERRFLNSFNEKTLALETEAESIARYFYEQGEEGQLTGYIVLRAISDHADKEKNDLWKLAASRNAVLALEAILPTVMETITLREA